MLNELQLTFLLISHVFCPSIFRYLPFCTYGHAVQLLPHVFIPLKFLFGCVGGGGATFDLIRKFLKLFCLLYAVKGGFTKHSFKYLFWVIIDLQCLATTCGMDGSLGSYFIEKTGRFSVAFF